MFDKNKLRELLKKYEPEDIEKYCDYCNKVQDARNSKGQRTNMWFDNLTNETLYKYYIGVKSSGLTLDGEHVTIQKTGVTFDYIAYKNKMFLAYPESIIDVNLVRENDRFSFKKESGKVIYSHEITDPFGNSKIIGAYSVIKNKRGEFLTVLSEADIEKHRKIAKTDFIWKQWTDEMYLKTIIKKGCKTHFSDIYQSIETLDNDNYDLENSLELPLETKQEIELLETVKDVENYYKENNKKHSGIKQDFIKACADRKAQIQEGF